MIQDDYSDASLAIFEPGSPMTLLFTNFGAEVANEINIKLGIGKPSLWAEWFRTSTSTLPKLLGALLNLLFFSIIES